MEFPGIITEADTKRELLIMINDVIEGFFEAFPEEKENLHTIQKSEVIMIAV